MLNAPALAPILVSVFASTAEKTVAVYRVELSFPDKLVGGIPASPDSMAAWIRTKTGITKEDEIQRMVIENLRENISEEVVPGDGSVVPFDDLKTSSEKTAREINGTRFHRDGGGLVIESRIVMSMLNGPLAA